MQTYPAFYPKLLVGKLPDLCGRCYRHKCWWTQSHDHHSFRLFPVCRIKTVQTLTHLLTGFYSLVLYRNKEMWSKCLKWGKGTALNTSFYMSQTLLSQVGTSTTWYPFTSPQAAFPSPWWMECVCNCWLTLKARFPSKCIQQRNNNTAF